MTVRLPIQVSKQRTFVHICLFIIQNMNKVYVQELCRPWNFKVWSINTMTQNIYFHFLLKGKSTVSEVTARQQDRYINCAFSSGCVTEIFVFLI